MRRLTAIVLGSLLLVACQGQQANLLTDPSAILQAAASTTAAARTVHIDVTADGPIAIDPLGTGAGAAVNLKGTTAAIDADLAASKLHATFLSPNLLNLSAEVITTDGSTYLKSSFTGPKFQVTATPVDASPSVVPLASAMPAQALSMLTTLLSRPGLQLTKGDDVPCAGGTCYTVMLHLSAADLQALGGGAASPAPSGTAASPGPSASGLGGLSGLPGIGGALSGIALPDLSTATADLAIHVEQTSRRLSGIDATVHLGDMGDPKLTFTFTKWDEPVAIQAPPADQVQPAG